MRDICLNGTPDERLEQVAEWRDCGVRYVVLANLSFLRVQPTERPRLGPPFNQIVRRLRKL